MSPPLSMSPVLTVHCMASYISVYIVFCSLALKKLKFTAASKILRPGNDRGYASRLCTIDCCEKTVTTKGVNFSHLPLRKVIRARLPYFVSVLLFLYFSLRTSAFSTCPLHRFFHLKKKKKLFCDFPYMHGARFHKVGSSE